MKNSKVKRGRPRKVQTFVGQEVKRFKPSLVKMDDISFDDKLFVPIIQKYHNYAINLNNNASNMDYTKLINPKTGEVLHLFNKDGKKLFTLEDKIGLMHKVDSDVLSRIATSMVQIVPPQEVKKN